MSFILQPWQLLFVILAGWVNEQQQQVIEYLRTENQVLKEKLGKKRILLSDDQRRRLAVKGKVLGRKRLEQIGTFVHARHDPALASDARRQKWDYSSRRTEGWPTACSAGDRRACRAIGPGESDLGLRSDPGRLANLGYHISDQTVGNILQEHGIEPAPDRKRQTTWKTFIKAHWDVLAAIDFTTIEVWTKGGLVTFYLLFVMEVATRRVHFAGCTPSPHDQWMKRMAINLTDCVDGFLLGKRYVLMDRDAKFSAAFRSILEAADIKSVRLPPRSPNLNAHLERFFGSLKSECLDRMIFFGEESLRRAVKTFLAHYHEERSHQGLGNRLISPGEEAGRTSVRLNAVSVWAACFSTTTVVPRDR